MRIVGAGVKYASSMGSSCFQLGQWPRPSNAAPSPASLQGLRHHIQSGEGQMKKILLMALLAAFVSGTTMPTLTKVLGFGSAAAYAQDDQGENNDVDVDADSAAGG